MDKLFYEINTVILGYVLTFSGLFLNFHDGEKLGVIMALLSFGAAYFAERSYDTGTNFPKLTAALQIFSIVTCAASLAVWII